MHNLSQKTVKSDISFSGIGLHTGNIVDLTIKPAQPNNGIIFKRTDLKENNIIIPGVFNVSSANFCTTISNDFDVSVSTIEHLMGALFILGVDNAVIEINNNEVPILDGSAKEFINQIVSSGLKVSDVPIKIIKINKKIEYKDGDRFITIQPSTLSLDIDFELK